MTVEEDDEEGILSAGDGLRVLIQTLQDMKVDVLDIVVRTARWPDPRTFRALPLWYPAHHRGMPLYNSDWRTPAVFGEGSKRSGDRKHETNYKARDALKAALGGREPNWTCCHIWGYDDASFQDAKSLTHDRRFYTLAEEIIEVLAAARTRP